MNAAKIILEEFDSFNGIHPAQEYSGTLLCQESNIMMLNLHNVNKYL